MATGLYYFNARWYDASTGRFTTEDPIRDGWNWYGYANQNPLRFTDPTGPASLVPGPGRSRYFYHADSGVYDSAIAGSGAIPYLGSLLNLGERSVRRFEGSIDLDRSSLFEAGLGAANTALGVASDLFTAMDTVANSLLGRIGRAVGVTNTVISLGSALREGLGAARAIDLERVVEASGLVTSSSAELSEYLAGYVTGRLAGTVAEGLISARDVENRDSSLQRYGQPGFFTRSPHYYDGPSVELVRDDRSDDAIQSLERDVANIRFLYSLGLRFDEFDDAMSRLSTLEEVVDVSEAELEITR